MISASHGLGLPYRTIGSDEHTRRTGELLAIIADGAHSLAARFEALESLASLESATASNADADTALDVLEDDRFLDAVVAAELGWTLFTVAALGERDAVWSATRGVLAARLEAAGETGVALAQLQREGDEWSRAAETLVAAEPATPLHRPIWLLVVAQWLAEPELRSEVRAALASAGVLERVATDLDGLDGLGGAAVDELREWLLESLK